MIVHLFYFLLFLINELIFFVDRGIDEFFVSFDKLTMCYLIVYIWAFV